jgi:hypothetical protein
MPTTPDKGSSSDPVIEPTKKTWQEEPADDAPAGEPSAESAESADGVVSPDKKTWQ